MNWVQTLPPNAIRDVGAALAAEPEALDAFLANPRDYARNRFGVNLPEGFAATRSADGIRVGVGEETLSLALDELPDDVLDSVAGGSQAMKSEDGRIPNMG